MSDLEDRIRARAHLLWDAAGRPEGRDEEFWLAAEAELKAAAAPAKAKPKAAAKPRPAAKPKAAAKVKA